MSFIQKNTVTIQHFHPYIRSATVQARLNVPQKVDDSIGQKYGRSNSTKVDGSKESNWTVQKCEKFCIFDRRLFDSTTVELKPRTSTFNRLHQRPIKLNILYRPLSLIIVSFYPWSFYLTHDRPLSSTILHFTWFMDDFSLFDIKTSWLSFQQKLYSTRPNLINENDQMTCWYVVQLNLRHFKTCELP